MQPVRQLLDDAIARGLFSAAAISVGDRGREVYRDALGTTRTEPALGDAIDSRTWFDLASLTKPIATAAIAARASFDLAGAPPGAPKGVTWIHLLGHAAGYPAHKKYYEKLEGRGAIIGAARREPLERPPGTAAVYSDVGYLVLGAALEDELDSPLDELFSQYVAMPFNLRARYFDLMRRARPTPVAATELGTPDGAVHDENARAAGGVCGHAGLFGTIEDVGGFARQWLELLTQSDRARFLADTSAAPGATWRLGWDTPSAEPGISHAGDRWPRTGTLGHLGFTGTSLWLDRERNRWVALLTNRVHPSRDGERAAAIKDVRRAVMDATVEVLG